jgi:Ca2+-binding EF-hand superfamily protein
MQDQAVPLTFEEEEAFFRAVDLNEDGKISYSELVEAVHLMEPLPYAPGN